MMPPQRLASARCLKELPVNCVSHPSAMRGIVRAVAVIAALVVLAPGLSAQSRDGSGPTGDPLVDSILQAPGPDFLEPGGRQRGESGVWDRAPRESAREPRYDTTEPAEQWDRGAGERFDRREPDPAPAQSTRREPPPPPAQRSDAPLDMIVLEPEASAPQVAEARPSEPGNTQVRAPARTSGDAANAAAAGDSGAAMREGDEASPEQPAPRAPVIAEPEQVAAVSTAASTRSLPDLPVQAPERPKPDPQLNRMIGQMIMVGFPGQTPSTQGVRRVGKQLEAGQVGGAILMSRNIDSPRQVKRLTRYLTRAGEDHPTPFIAVDQEGGYVQRLSRVKGFKTHPSAERLGARNDPQGAYEAYRALALELRDYGFNVNLGPVVDLNLNASNPVIGRLKRSYGKDPDHVTAFAKAFVYAHNESGVLTAAKHFPGHGSSDTDSHNVLVDISESWQERELRPYRKLIEAGAIDMIMTGHLYHPTFSERADTPASLSAKAIERVLRESLNYDGVVITDDLDMRGVRQNTSFPERIVGAVSAGNDILLITNANGYEPDLPKRVGDAIRAAIAAGDLSIERIRKSYERILALKDELARLQRTATGAGENRGLSDHTSDG
jgi:beta-N-acetylhexosaminidase